MVQQKNNEEMEETKLEVGDEFTRTGIPGPLIGRLFLRASVWLEAAILLFFPLV